MLINFTKALSAYCTEPGFQTTSSFEQRCVQREGQRSTERESDWHVADCLLVVCKLFVGYFHIFFFQAWWIDKSLLVVLLEDVCFEIKTLDSECDIYWKQWTKYFRIQNNINASFKQVMARKLNLLQQWQSSCSWVIWITKSINWYRTPFSSQCKRAS